MTNYIIVIFIAVSIIFSIINNNVTDLSNALLNSSNMAVKTVINLIGSMALWGGVMRIAKTSGLTNKLCKLLKKPVKLLFPELNEKSRAFEAISMNITANLLGLGNAATPLGITAMKELYKNTSSRKSMAMLVVINTASIQLIPVTVATLRLSNGSNSPWDFVPSVLIVSLISLTIGCTMVKMLYLSNEKKRV